ncbi:helix-turn-helix transcriptional regulator [Tsukamurella ocularis]|uniref:helix-turn-helix transcriptional regulator n=1 Tax=Tsukamurella ocularis TaxID=1970234 RepID=UPI00216A226C|nr:helix-turn-helix transcriptional regulator [Tsukamurella ocularis]MCS3780118.1 transcriptional regulator with XRE-family HTH domain [Tsukamurella ocularis]MCS3786328.1 transcriptional regulator with XRE-family HTH domain [Tsukamurella ocularis]MCS3849692.1 transcriptional regulator with XRE-family HTH domain [Tsukamurella ocularis]
MNDSDFGATLRRWRDRVSPADIGVHVGGRRRTSGLRREELAGLAGISVDYLTRLEQGRATAPSAQVVESLARALRLTDVERDLLFRLSGHATPGPGIVPARITASVQRLLDRLADTPVAVFDAMWNLLVANAPYDALMGPTTGRGAIERNSVRRNLLGPEGRTVLTPDERADLQAGLVADLRLTAARYPTDQQLRHLIRELSGESPRFVELWNADAPRPTGDAGRRKSIDHPQVGRITVDCDTLLVAGDDLRIMIYTAEPGSADADRLALAMVLGSATAGGWTTGSDDGAGPTDEGRAPSNAEG